MSTLSIMITANFIMLGILIRFTHIWGIIAELNEDPRYCPIIGCIGILVVFFMIIIMVKVS